MDPSAKPNGTSDEGQGDKGGLFDGVRGQRHDEPHIKLEALDHEQVKAAAAGAALAHVLSRPDSIRQRAQNAATISSAVAAALVIAGVSQLAGGKLSPVSLGGFALLLALALWVIGIWLFVYAVAFIDKGAESPEGYQELVKSYEDYADKVRAQTRLAATVSGFALLATVAAVVVEVIELKPLPDQRMQILLTKEGAAGITAMCSWESSDSIRLEGLVASTDLRQSLVQIKDVTLLTTTKKPAGLNAQHPGKCVDDGIDVRVPRSAIRVARNTDP